MLYTCSLSASDDPILRPHNSDVRELIIGARVLALNALEKRMTTADFPERMRGRTGVSQLSSEAYTALNREVSTAFAKCALKNCSSSEFYNTDDISILAEKQVNANAGVQDFVVNALSAILTPIFPAMQSNLFEMLCETRYGAVGETFEFDVPSNEAYTWSAGARGSRSYAHDQRESNTLNLNPTPVGTKFDIPWIRLARGEYDFGGDLLAATLGWSSYTLGLLVKELAKWKEDAADTAFHAPSFTHDNFIEVRSNVSIANGNMGRTFAFGSEKVLSKILPEKAEMLSAIGDDWVQMGHLPVYARTPLIPINDAFVPGTYSSKNPKKVIGDDDSLYMFSAGGERPFKMAIGGGMVTVTRDKEQTSNKVTSYTLETEVDMGLITGNRGGFIEGVA